MGIVTKKLKHPTYTPDWINENENYSQEWLDFVSVYWTQSTASVDTKRACVRDLCRWAVEKRGFKTPNDIETEDLPELGRSEGVTYFEYLRDYKASDNYKAKAWANASRIFTLVAKAAKLPGSPFYGWNLKNPFDGLRNRFDKFNIAPRIKEALRSNMDSLLNMFNRTKVEREHHEHLKEEVVRLNEELSSVKAKLKRYEGVTE